MKKIVFSWLVLLIAVNIFSVTILFDNTKYETAGNADWIIGSSPQWVGGYSEFGEALRDLGYNTQTLSNGSIDSGDLQNVDVFIIPEPQEPFSNSEKNAILQFVNNGGGLFMIGNHVGSDRCNNGWDSPRVFNESLNSGSNFGFTFQDEGFLYVTPTTRFENPRTALTENLNSVGMYAGSSINVTGANVNTNIYLRNFDEPGLVSTAYGSGRVAAYGDSSPWDDGTGNPNNNLHDGWSDYDNAQMGLNVVNWLLGATTAPSELEITDIVFDNSVLLNTTIPISCNIDAGSVGIERAFLYWNTGAGFHPLLMANSGSNYSTTIPAQSEECVVSFYIQVMLANNNYGYYPEGAPETLEDINVGPVANSDDVTPLQNQLSVYPNPWNPATSDLKIESQSGSTVKLYDLKGRVIKEIKRSGDTQVVTSDFGTKLRSGIYFIKSGNSIKKVSIIK